MTDSTLQSARPRILIVGAGRRVQNNFLPALNCLAGSFTIAGIHSRTPERLLPVAERWNIPAFTTWDQVDLNTIDVVAISVQTSQNAIVLNRLAAHASRLSIVIDTPIAWNRKELASTLTSFRNFKRVLVTEDYMNYPKFELLRRAVQQGLIGTLRGTTLYNIGYLYHGLALIRSFNGFERARRTWSRSVGSFSYTVGYDFPDGYKAIVVGPYRRLNEGGITIEGTSGILTDFPEDLSAASAGKRPVHILETRRDENHLITGFSLSNTDNRFTIETPAIQQMAKMNFDDKSDLNMLRGCGLIHIFQALQDDANINNSYGPDNAIYDSFAPRLAQKGVMPFDPFVSVGSDFPRLLRRLVALRG